MPLLRRDLRNDPVPWKIGEHIAVIGTTGTGKTFLTSKLANLREYCVMLQTKADDNKFQGFRRTRNPNDMQHVYARKLLIEPEYEQQVATAFRVFRNAWKQGRWTLFLDELFYIQDELGLKSEVNKLLTQGRSKRLSIVTGMQRPAWVTRFALSEVAHVFTFGLEKRDAKTLGQSTSEALGELSINLDQYEFAHFHRPTRTVTVGNANDLDRIIISPSKLVGAEAIHA
jgi:hypothetical protein